MKYLAMALVGVAGLLFDATVICGTSYVVFWMDESGWWFVLAVLLGHGVTLGTYKIVNAINNGTKCEMG